MMKMMPTRYEMLSNSLNVFNDKKVFFLLKSENGYQPLWGGDDLGVYYFVVKTASLFGFALDNAIKFFFASILFISYLIVIYFFLKYSTKSLIPKIYAIITFGIVAVFSYTIGDVYILYTVAPMICITAFIINYKSHKLWLRYIVFIIIGLIIGYSNFIRAHSGTIALVFIILSILLSSQKIKFKTIVLAFLFIGVLLTKAHFNYLLNERNEFLRNKKINFEVKQKHVFWHNTFLGLGFMYNKHNLYPKDEVALEWALRINPEVKYFSDQYETVIKKEYFKFIFNNPGYVLMNYSAKIGVILFFIIGSLNIGLYALFKVKKDELFYPFCGAIFMGVLPGLIFLPYDSYILGGITVSVLMANYYFTKMFAKE